ncbi:MAG: ComEC/Rec2 family competence protein, partial [Clostridia bacterium]|nr:ComEC/Rec2 family competence protein [Clostridia bacterium]
MSLFSKRPLALCSLFFLFGSLLTYLVNANGIGCLWALLPFLLFFAISLLLGICKRSPLSLLAIALSFSLLLGFLIQLGYHRRRFAPWEQTAPGAPHSIIGTVVEKSEGRYAEYTVDVKELDGRPVNISLILRTDPLEISPEIYDVLSCKVYVVTKGDPYDYSRGICGMAAPLATPTVTESSSPSLAHRLSAMRISLSERLKTGMQEEDAALLSAIFLGERTALSDATETAFRRSGLSHVLALSGLHLSILAGYLLRLLHRLRVPRAATFPLLFLFLLGYTAATGFSYSLIRAAVMLLVAELASLLRLIPDSVTSLFLAIAAIALCTPSSVSDLGLWLSFLATLGILCANELFPKLTKLKKRSRLLHATLFSLVLSTFALVFTLLLTTYSFGAFSLLSPFTNLILTPLIHLLLILAPFALLFPTVAGIPCGLVATACRATVTFFSGLPGYIPVDYLPFRLAM